MLVGRDDANVQMSVDESGNSADLTSSPSSIIAVSTATSEKVT